MGHLKGEPPEPIAEDATAGESVPRRRDRSHIRAPTGPQGRPVANGPSESSSFAGIAWLRATSLTLVTVLLLGCGLNIPADLRTPSVAGVVEDITQLPDGGTTYVLQNGKVAEIASRKTVLLGGEPLVGELLLAGTDPDGRHWVAGVPEGSPGLPEGCFLLPSQGGVAGAWIEATTGLRLKKA